jgi:hypothetical protein
MTLLYEQIGFHSGQDKRNLGFGRVRVRPGLYRLSKNAGATSKFRVQKGGIRQVPYWESRVLGATVQNLVATEICVPPSKTFTGKWVGQK